MILLDINPLSKPVAISEMLILLAVTALVGWLIGRWITNGKIRSLRESLADRQGNLEDCRKSTNLSFVASTVPVTTKIVTVQNLKVIEGIGPKIEQLLHKNGILTLDQLAKTTPERISEIFQLASPGFQMHDPTTWPKQAALAHQGKWDALSELQEKLDGGRVV